MHARDRANSTSRPGLPASIPRGLVGALLFVLLVLAARFKYFRQMVLDGVPYLADADCYTRLTRVRALLEDGRIFRSFHPWENTPDGITTHTTALLDLVIAVPASLFGAMGPTALDWSGWLIPPLLAGLTAVVLWRVSDALQLGWTRWPVLLTFALHPLTLWANAAGRPDHQALVVPLLTLALFFDLLRSREASRTWIHASAVTWGLALWVSLYEPLILFLPTLVVTGVYLRTQTVRWLGLVLAITLPGWVLEGWRWSGETALWNDPLLQNWLAMIGELKRPPAWQAVSFVIALPAAVHLLVRVLRSPKETFIWLRDGSFVLPLALTLVVAGFGLVQQRWLALLPVPLALASFHVLRPLTSPAMRTLWITLHLLPLLVWSAVETTLVRPPHELARVRELAQEIRRGGPGGILAPWWFSPALLYYSGQPIVASSSHQSLPGIVDSARFFISTDFTEADGILQRRGVHWVAIYRPERTFANARQILHGPGADVTIAEKDFYRYVMLRLWDFKTVPTRYRIVYASPDWRLYRYDPRP